MRVYLFLYITGRYGDEYLEFGEITVFLPLELVAKDDHEYDNYEISFHKKTVYGSEFVFLTQTLKMFSRR